MLDVLDQCNYALFADLPLVSGHDGRVSLGNVLRRVQDGLAQVGVVGGDGLAAGECELGAVDIGQAWAARVGPDVVAGVAAKAGEEALAILGERVAAGGTGQPLLEVVWREHHDVTDHLRVVSAAVLGAKEVIGAGRGGFKPDSRVSARNGFTLDAECGDREAVKHVLRDEGQLDWLAGGHMQGVDFVLTAGMLGLPHPLLANDVDVHGVGRRSVDAEVEERAPHKHDEERPRGMMVQVASSSVEPSIWMACGWRSLL